MASSLIRTEGRKCAYMDRECNSDCVAYIGDKPDWSFLCARVTMEYDAVMEYIKAQENLCNSLNAIADNLCRR